MSPTRVEQRRKPLLLVLLAVGVLVATLLVPVNGAPAGASAASLRCTAFSRKTALSDTGPTKYTITGHFCTPTDRPVTAAQVLISGATYGQIYWDFPVDQPHYSYVRAAAAQGYATVNFDRVGIGSSSHPLGTSVTTQAGAYEVHQLVSALRAGAFGQRFGKVMTVAHSYGSVIAIREAASYDDVDGMVISGLLHHLDAGLSKLEASLYPADTDPAKRFAGLDPSYLTTIPNSRGDLFYYRPNADPAVIARDEQTKQTFTLGEQSTFPTELMRSVSVRTPTLVIVGDQDKFFCTLQACSTPTTGAASLEPAFWARDCLSVETVPDAGHDLALQRNANVFYGDVSAWTRTNVADSRTATAAKQRCLASPPALKAP